MIGPKELLTLGMTHKRFSKYVNNISIWTFYWNRWCYTPWMFDAYNTNNVTNSIQSLREALMRAHKSWSVYSKPIYKLVGTKHRALFVDKNRGRLYVEIFAVNEFGGNKLLIHETGQYIPKSFLSLFPPEQIVTNIDEGTLRQSVGRVRRAASHKPMILDILD